MQAILFEDARVRQLYPISIGRPAYMISCGSYRLVDWVDELRLPWSSVVRPHLRVLQQQDHGVANPSAADEDDNVLLINARLVPSVAALTTLCRLRTDDREMAVWCGNELAAGVFPAAFANRVLANHPVQFERETCLESSEWAAFPRSEGKDLAVFEYPHDVVRWNARILPDNLELRLSRGGYQQVADGVFAAEGARLGQFIVSDTRNGPIVLDAGASIGPYTYLSGPVYLGRAARVIEHSAIKDAVSIAHTTKIGGEVEASVIEAYTNKQHHGFLGHSYLGSWINLGAGTCNSDLKNTYGEVKMEYHGRKVATGMQFIGCVIGDYSKTAINTSIFTGKTVGVCSMLYGFVTTNVPSFVNYARSFGQVTELPPDVMVATQQRMFQRRSVTQRECDMQIIHDMYELTTHERQLAGEPLSL